MRNKFPHYTIEYIVAGANTAFRQVDETIAKMISEEKAKLSAASK